MPGANPRISRDIIRTVFIVFVSYELQSMVDRVRVDYNYQMWHAGGFGGT
jgi:hypothetical protein